MSQLIYIIIIAMIMIAVMVVLFSCLSSRMNRCLRLLEKNVLIDNKTVVKYECRETNDSAVQELHDLSAIEEYERLGWDFLSVLQENDLYLDPDLKIQKVADLLHVNVRELSAVINQIYKTNFNNLVNSMRIKKAIRIYCDNPEIGMEELSKASGFKSKPPFYHAFSREMGKTPAVWIRDYRKLNQKVVK